MEFVRDARSVNRLGFQRLAFAPFPAVRDCLFHFTSPGLGEDANLLLFQPALAGNYLYKPTH